MFEFHPSKVATVKNDILSGLTVALALVPEAVAFAFVAGVEPLVGLYAAFMVGLITACIGGRPGMISAATGPGFLDPTCWKFVRRSLPASRPAKCIHSVSVEKRILPGWSSGADRSKQVPG